MPAVDRIKGFEVHYFYSEKPKNIVRIENNNGKLYSLEDAKHRMKAVNSIHSSLKSRIRSIFKETDEDYEERDRKRWESGQYKKLPFHDTCPFQSVLERYVVRICEDQKGRVTLFDTLEHRKNDFAINIKLGRFIEKYVNICYFDEGDLNYNIDYYCAILKVETGDINYELKIAESSDDCVHVYQNGPHSCMTKIGRYACSPRHPAIVYGGDSDLTVAYVVKKNKHSDSIIGRTIIHKDRKIFSHKIYGDVGITAYLLKKAGYNAAKSLDELQGNGRQHKQFKLSFAESKINRIDFGDGVILPYIDYLVGESASLSEDGKSIILHQHEDGEFGVRTETGVSENAGEFHACDECGQYTHEDNSIFSESLGRGFCENCFYKIHRCCDSCEEYTLSENTVYIQGGYNVCQDCFMNEGYFECDICYSFYDSNDAAEIQKEDQDKDDIHKYDFICQNCYDKEKTI